MSVKPCCLLSLPNEPGCSGIIVHGPSGFILSHAVLLLPLFNQNEKLLKRLLANKVLHWEQFKKTRINAVFEHKVSKKGSIASNFITTIVNMVRPSVTSSTFAEARVLCVWNAKKFEQILHKLFPSEDNWTFHENAHMKEQSDDDAKKVAQLLPFFVLLQVKDQIPCDVPQYLPSSSVNIGDSVQAVATPFGTLSPPVFLNSRSKGIVCNKSGKDDCLILTDARCIPGCEGGGLYMGDDDRCLMGIVVAPLCWKANEWVGYTIVCSIEAVIDSLDNATKSMRSIALSKQDLNRQTSDGKMDTSRIVLVQAPLVWGTGLLVDSEAGIVLTCGHVVKKSKYVDVEVSLPSGHRWFQAEILKAVPEQRAFDIAVLRLVEWGKQANNFSDISITEEIEEGSNVVMAGYGVFGREHNLQPTITRGSIAKVVNLNGRVAMVQATCAVHAGASGGPLVAEDGSFVGIVTCNAKDTASGALYPHINFSVPLVTIWPVLQHFMHTNDVSVLDALDVAEADMQKLWRLQLKEIAPDVQLNSKL